MYLTILIVILVILVAFQFVRSTMQSKKLDLHSSFHPKVIIQTYHNKKLIPKKVYENIKKFCPGYKHIIFDDNQCINFLSEHYGVTMVNAFNKFNGAHKADLFRYCYLYTFGGIYLDIKTELIENIENTFPKPFVYTVLSINKGSIYQGIICTPKKNPIFLKLIKFMLETQKSQKKFQYILFTIDFFNKIKEECKYTPRAGININKVNPMFNYYLLVEKCSKSPKDCYDKLDRYGLCCYVTDKGQKLIKSRYSDFPW